MVDFVARFCHRRKFWILSFKLGAPELTQEGATVDWSSLVVGLDRSGRDDRVAEARLADLARGGYVSVHWLLV
jgi:hypothetical protein